MEEQFKAWWNDDYCKTHSYTSERDRAVAKVAFEYVAKGAIAACLSTKDEPDCYGVLDQLSDYGNTAVDCCVDAIKEQFGLEI